MLVQVETGQMSAAETGQMSAVERRQVYSIKTGQSPVTIVDISLSQPVLAGTGKLLNVRQ